MLEINKGLITVSDAAVLCHDTFVESFGFLGNTANSLWSWVPSSPSFIKEGAKKVFSFPKNLVTSVAITSMAKTMQVTNRILGKHENATALREYRADVTELNGQMKQTLFQLCEACSSIFGHKIIFSHIPTSQEIELLIEKIHQAESSKSYLPRFSNSRVAESAIGHCRTLLGQIETLERYMEAEISPEDFKSYYASFEKSVVLQLGVNATVENIGEFSGGMVVDSLLPVGYNPAVIVGTHLSQALAPLGKFGGAIASMAGINYLLDKLPLFRFDVHRKEIKIAAFLLLFGLEYAGMNPLSNYLQDKVGSIGYDFGYYTVALLFNYIGMAMARTDESLGSYTRKMTPSMLVYKGTDMAMSQYGFGFTTRLITAFYLSHVAYNFETYKNAAQGNLVNGSLAVRDLEQLIQSERVKIVGQGLTASMLSSLSSGAKNTLIAPVQKEGRELVQFGMMKAQENLYIHQMEQLKQIRGLVDTSCENLLFNIHEAFQGFKLPIHRPVQKMIKAGRDRFQMQLPSNPLEKFQKHFENESDALIEKMVTKGHKYALEEYEAELLARATPQLTEFFSNVALNLEQLKGEKFFNGSQFVLREFNKFSELLKTPEIRSILKRYNQELVKVLDQTKISTLTVEEGGSTLEDLEEELFTALIRDNNLPIPGGILLKGVLNLYDQEGHDCPFFDPNIEKFLNNNMDYVYPLLPTPSEKKKTCSVHLLNLISKAFLIKMSFDMGSKIINLESDGATLKSKDYLKLMDNLLHLFIEARHPDESLPTWARRKVALKALRSQF